MGLTPFRKAGWCVVTHRPYVRVEPGVKGVRVLAFPGRVRPDRSSSGFVSHVHVTLLDMSGLELDIEQTFGRVSNMSSVRHRTSSAGPIRRETT